MLVALGIVAWHTRAGSRFDGIHIMNLHYFGVDFFFVLSGFVLSNQIKKAKSGGERHTPTFKFLWTRFIRLWPNAVTILTFALLVQSALYIYQISGSSTSFEDAFGTNPIWAWPIAILFGQLSVWPAWMWYGPLWSIAAIWWATVITVTFPVPKKIRPELFFLGLGVLVQIICIYRNGSSIADGQMFFGFTGLCRALVGINLGLLLRRYLDNKKSQINVFVLGTLCLVSLILAIAVDYKFHNKAILVSTFLWVPVVLLLVSIKNPTEDSKIGRLFLWMGKYSFPLFIWHVLMIHIIRNLGSFLPAKLGQLLEPFEVQYILVVASSLVLSVLSTNSIEPWIRKYLVASGEKHLKFLAPTSDSKLV